MGLFRSKAPASMPRLIPAVSAGLRQWMPFRRFDRAVPEFLVDDVRLDRCAGLAEFNAYLAATRPQQEERAIREQALIGPEPSFAVPGTCPVCRVPTHFQVGFEHSFIMPDGQRVPNWREHLSCSHCHLNSRMRAAVAFLMAVAGRGMTYLTEQITPLYRVARRRLGVVGSEFLRDGTKPGATNAAGIRHEDLTRLTFPSRSLGCVATLDVLEHVPDYTSALQEIYRCLRPSGSLVMTVPFALNSQATIVRAGLRPNGSIEHHLPPEYHGDPLDPAGTLCFYHFGWDLLDQLGHIGFRDAALHFYWSRDYGLLAGLQFIIHARR